MPLRSPPRWTRRKQILRWAPIARTSKAGLLRNDVQQQAQQVVEWKCKGSLRTNNLMFDVNLKFKLQLIKGRVVIIAILNQNLRRQRQLSSFELNKVYLSYWDRIRVPLDLPLFTFSCGHHSSTMVVWLKLLSPIEVFWPSLTSLAPLKIIVYLPTVLV